MVAGLLGQLGEPSEVLAVQVDDPAPVLRRARAAPVGEAVRRRSADRAIGTAHAPQWFRGWRILRKGLLGFNPETNALTVHPEHYLQTP